MNMRVEATEAMVVVMEERATEEQIEKVVARLVEMGMDVHRSTGVTRTVLGAVGSGHPEPGLIEMLDGVHEVMRISSPYKLASRTFKPEATVVTVGDVRIRGDEVIVMAGPCSIESREQALTIAQNVANAGAHFLRGGAYKPRTSPYSFQGLGEEVDSRRQIVTNILRTYYYDCHDHSTSFPNLHRHLISTKGWLEKD